MTRAWGGPLIITLKLQVDLSPAGVVAVQVIVVVPAGKVEPAGGTHTTPVPVGLPEMFGSGKFTAVEHCPAVAWTTTLPGQTMLGGCVSVTVTVKEQVEILPAVSLAEQFTVVVPVWNVAPEGGVQLFEKTEQLSITRGNGYVTTTDLCPWSGEVNMFSGQVILGATLSTTVTKKLQVAAKALATAGGSSAAAQETVVVPTGKNEPGDGLHTSPKQEPVVPGNG
jgi:hypothetical protein